MCEIIGAQLFVMQVTMIDIYVRKHKFVYKCIAKDKDSAIDYTEWLYARAYPSYTLVNVTVQSAQ